MGNMRVDFKPSNFQTLIEEKGYDLTLYHAIPCPCVSTDTGQPDPNCSMCERGWQYFGSELIKGICSGFSAEKQFADPGHFLIGSMQLTTHANIKLGYHDRIVNQNSLITFTELILKEANYTSKFRYDPVEIIRLIGNDGTVYLKDRDFTIADRAVTWLYEDTQPDDDSYFSVAYQMHPIWLCTSFPHLVRSTHVKFRHSTDTHYAMPIQVLCKLEWLVEE